MLQKHALASQHLKSTETVSTVRREKQVAESDQIIVSGLANALRSHGLSAQLKSNTVVVLSALAVEGESKLYAVRCMAGGEWSLQTQAGLQAYDPAVHLVVINQNGKLGFRSAIAEGRLLCCNHLYHLAFKHWQMDYQEAWCLRGYSLADCSLRNQKYKLTLNVRITVLAEPTDALGNTRITPALLASPPPVLDPAAQTFKSLKEFPTDSKRRLEHEDKNSSSFLFKSGTHKNPSSGNSASLKDFMITKHEVLPSGFLLNPATQIQRPFYAASSQNENFMSPYGVNSHVSTSYPSPRRGGTYLVQNLRQESGAIAPAKLGMSRAEGRSVGIRYRQESVTKGDEATFPSLSVDTGSNTREIYQGARQSKFNDTQSRIPALRSCYFHTSVQTRRIRRWKRSTEVYEKLLQIDREGSKLPNCGRKRAQPHGIFDKDGNGAVIDGSQSSSAGPLGSSGKVVTKRQSGYRSGTNDKFTCLTNPDNLEGNSLRSDGHFSTFSKSQVLEAKLNTMKVDAERKEREKAIHWKLQAAVRLLKLQTQQELASVAKTATSEAINNTADPEVRRNTAHPEARGKTFHQEARRNIQNDKMTRDCKRELPISVDEILWMAAGRWRFRKKHTTVHSTKERLSQPNLGHWNYHLKQVTTGDEKHQASLVSAMTKDISSRFPLFLKLWLWFPVPLVALAYLILVYRQRKEAS